MRKHLKSRPRILIEMFLCTSRVDALEANPHSTEFVFSAGDVLSSEIAKTVQASKKGVTLKSINKTLSNMAHNKVVITKVNRSGTQGLYGLNLRTSLPADFVLAKPSSFAAAARPTTRKKKAAPPTTKTTVKKKGRRTVGTLAAKFRQDLDAVTGVKNAVATSFEPTALALDSKRLSLSNADLNTARFILNSLSSGRVSVQVDFE